MYFWSSVMGRVSSLAFHRRHASISSARSTVNSILSRQHSILDKICGSHGPRIDVSLQLLNSRHHSIHSLVESGQG